MITAEDWFEKNKEKHNKKPIKKFIIDAYNAGYEQCLVDLSKKIPDGYRLTVEPIPQPKLSWQEKLYMALKGVKK